MCWSPVTAAAAADSPVGRHCHSAVVHRHRMWVYGGLSGLTALDDLWTWHFGASVVRQRLQPCLHTHTRLTALCPGLPG